MIAIAAGVVWAGYVLLWLGRDKLKGCDTRLSELVVPGRYEGCSEPAKTAGAGTAGDKGKSGFGSKSGGAGSGSSGGGGASW